MNRRAMRGNVEGLQIFVRDPGGAAEFLREALGFVVRVVSDGARDESESWLADNGALRLRLSPVASSSFESAVAPIWLEIETESIAESSLDLAGRRGLRQDGDVLERSDRLEQRFETDYGFGLVLQQHLTEDDLQELVPLPSTLDWTQAADHLTRLVLRHVPLPFRDGARQRATERAEELALIEGRPCVELENARRALFDTTPEFQHEALRAALDSGERQLRRVD